MRLVLTILLSALTAAPAAAAPGLLAGVSDDWTKWTSGADRIGSVYRHLGLDVVRVTVPWRPYQLVDERHLGGWQSGLLTPDLRLKPSFEAYRAAIAEVRRRAVDCSRFPAPARR